MTSFFKPGPATDPIYINARDGLENFHVRGREYLERIYRESAPYVDHDSAEKATRDLAAVFWELQLAYAVKSAGKNLVQRDRLKYKNNKGPDLFVEDPDVWLEAVVATRGEGLDALQYPETMMKVCKKDFNGIVLRLRSVIEDKSKQFNEYKKDGIVKPNQATVIAISGVLFPDRFPGKPPEIVRAVYPAGNLATEFNRVTKTMSDLYLEYRDCVKKIGGAGVATDIFLKPEFSHISVVLYGYVNWVDPPNPPGADFIIVHNPMALTPLPDGWFPFGVEYWCRDGERLESRRHGSL